MMKLTEDRVIQSLSEFIKDCDADELARLAGEVFGGECFCRCQKVGKPLFGEGCVCDEMQNIYEFEPNEFYADEFGKIETKN